MTTHADIAVSPLPSSSRSRPFRSVGAVVAGMIASVVLSSAVDFVLHRTGIYPPQGQPMAVGLWILATTYRAAIQVGGGFLTARLAPRRPLAHVFALGLVGLLASIGGVLATWNAGPGFGPRWYPLALVVLALPTVWLGGLAASKPKR